jgi:hypothetical protein
VDPGCAPQRVLPIHPLDQFANLAIDLWPPCPVSRFPNANLGRIEFSVGTAPTAPQDTILCGASDGMSALYPAEYLPSPSSGAWQVTAWRTRGLGVNESETARNG